MPDAGDARIMYKSPDELYSIIPGRFPSYGPSASNNILIIDYIGRNYCILFRSTLCLAAREKNCRKKTPAPGASPYAGTIYIFSILRMHYGHGSGMARNISSNPS